MPGLSFLAAKAKGPVYQIAARRGGPSERRARLGAAELVQGSLQPDRNLRAEPEGNGTPWKGFDFLKDRVCLPYKLSPAALWRLACRGAGMERTADRGDKGLGRAGGKGTDRSGM